MAIRALCITTIATAVTRQPELSVGSSTPAARRVDALIEALTERSQPLEVRCEAAESLAYRRSTRAVPPLISCLTDPDAGIQDREGRHTDKCALPALEKMLADSAMSPGNWWSVASEALAAQGKMNPPIPKYRDLVAAEIVRVLSDPHASPEDRRWAEGYQ